MRAAPLLLILIAAGSADAQQQGSLQISTETQVLRGDEQRRTGEPTFQPDIGAFWSHPGRRFGQFQFELRAAQSTNGMRLGRTWLALRDLKSGGLVWTFEGGDLYTSVDAGDARFSNLSAPSLTFSGGAVSARSSRATLQLAAGRTTAWRNIFGTDPDVLGQWVGLARGSYQATPRLQLTTRASHVRTTDLAEFTRTIDASDEGGSGVRLTLRPSIVLVGDGAFVRYRATGATRWVNDYSYLGGAHVLIARGWLQLNASRFSPGEMPVLNAALQDRSGLFSAGEYDVFKRLKLFGGWESIDTNIRATGTALQRPSTTATRQFGGIRIRFASRSTLSVRLDGGDRVSRPAPVNLAAPLLIASTSDTGSLSAEVQTSARAITAFGRYTRRENVDSTFSSATYTQQDSAVQLFVNLTHTTQLFGVATLTDNRNGAGVESTFLQVSGGGQQQVFRPGLWLRLEGSASQHHDSATGFLVPRQAFSVGLNGQIAAHTTIGFNMYVDRAPVGFPGDPQAWLTRSTLRVVHTIPTGSVRVANATGMAGRSNRGTGTITGTVFADWNANGLPDSGEELLAGIPVAIGAISHVTTGRDGQFSFLNVPAGAQLVRLDLNALPVDFDAPAASDITIEISRGESRRVAFGLLPLGTVQGRVYEDVNRDGALDAGDLPLDGPVLVLDGGQRSELLRKGSFRFDAVRAGEHRLSLLKESLPDGATIVGSVDRAVAVTREAPQRDVLYLVTIEKRPEIRKVFPPRGGGPGGATGSASSSGRPGQTRAAPARPAAPSKPPAADAFTIQVAALSTESAAAAIVDDLKRVGFDAYLMTPEAGATPVFRVRVGTFASRTAAQRTVARLEDHLGLKLWVTKSATAR